MGEVFTRRGGRRFILLLVLPLVALGLGLVWWLAGGRYVTTSDAYVAAYKVLITPYVTGPVVAIHVREGEKVAVGAPLFDMDPKPYADALALAEGRLAAAKVEFANLRQSYASNQDQIAMGEQAVTLRQADYERERILVQHKADTITNEHTAGAALIQAKQILAFVQAQQQGVTAKLGGGLNATITTFPDYIEARSQVEEARLNLSHTKVVAPIAGIATQVSHIELGRVAPAGQPVFALVADKGLWVDANPKESDLTFVKTGLPASVTVDTFPGRHWRGTVCTIAPGTGAQFAVLPPQNASGNWVKVVQRIPLRFCFGKGEDETGLRAGMSAILSIDTGRKRSLATLLSALLSPFRANSAPRPSEGVAAAR